MTFADGFDLCMLLITVFFAVKGIVRGFSGEIFSLAGIVGGTYFAFQYADAVDGYLRELFTNMNPSLSWILSLVLIFIVFNVLCALTGTLVRMFLKMVWLSVLDRIGGFIVGAAKGLAIALIVTILLSKAQAIAPGLNLSGSRFVTLANTLLPVIQPHIDTSLPRQI